MTPFPIIIPPLGIVRGAISPSSSVHLYSSNHLALCLPACTQQPQPTQYWSKFSYMAVFWGFFPLVLFLIVSFERNICTWNNYISSKFLNISFSCICYAHFFLSVSLLRLMRQMQCDMAYVRHCVLAVLFWRHVAHLMEQAEVPLQQFQFYKTWY